MPIQAGVEKLNEDLHQPSEIRYESRSFSVSYLVSLAYRKGLISRVKLFVVVPQAIGISLRNNHLWKQSEEGVSTTNMILHFGIIGPWKKWVIHSFRNYGIMNKKIVVLS